MRGGGSTTTSSLPPIRAFSSSKANGTTSATFQSPISPGLSSFSTISVKPPISVSANDGGVATSSPTIGALPEGFDTPPDLNQELAALSDKLIKAINHTVSLEDSVQNTRHELELSKARIKQLEAIAKQHEEVKGLLVEKKDVDIGHEQFMRRLKEERSQRSKVEKEKKSMEQELEHLTTALFEEANKMVTASRKEKDVMDRKNEQLRAQLQDTELLLASHQEQLTELKLVLQQMTAEREESEVHISTTPTPTTPALGNRSSKESLGRGFEAMSLSSGSPYADDSAPTNPLSLSHLIQPVLRYDTGSYHEFCSMLRTPKNSMRATSSGTGRLSGGSLTSFHVMGIGISSIASPHHSPTTVSNPSTSPSTPVQVPANPPTSLKETKFYKRVLVEDIEPTLRLDAAPGLSWLAKRSVFTATNDGSLVIEPIPASSKLHLMSCCLCGESRNDTHHVRTHKMRTSESDTTQKYPLCTYCVGRLRATCDFLAFLRAVKDGLWKCETEDDERHAWGEAIKLRDRMFWSRIGGGVVPAGMQHTHRLESQRNSLDQQLPSQTHNSSIQIQTPSPSSPRTPRAPALTSAKDTTPIAPKDGEKGLPYLAPVKKLSFGKFGFLDSNKVIWSGRLNAPTASKDEKQPPLVGEPSIDNGQEYHASAGQVKGLAHTDNDREIDSEAKESQILGASTIPLSPNADLRLPPAVLSTEMATTLGANAEEKKERTDHNDEKLLSISDRAPSPPNIPGSFL